MTANGNVQLELFGPDKAKAENLERAIDAIRRRFGHYSIQRAEMLIDRRLTGFNPKDQQVIHPVSFFGR